MSGATLQRTTEGMKVIGVNPETPAAEAGLEVGDVVREDRRRGCRERGSRRPAAALSAGRPNRAVPGGTWLDSLDVTLKLRRLL